MKTFRSANGMLWGIAVKVPSHSSAMVLFLNPDGTESHGDRYAWYNAHAAGANDPRSRLSPALVMEQLTDGALAKLFRRSMPVHSDRPSYVVS